MDSHVENQRLYGAADARITLTAREQNHLHECCVCQGVFVFFFDQVVSQLKNTSPAGSESEPAA